MICSAPVGVKLGGPGQFMRVAMTNSLSPARTPAKFLGIEIGGTKLQIVQGDAEGTIGRRWRATVDRGRGGPGILEQLRAGIDELTGGGAGGADRPAAIAVGFGGPVAAVGLSSDRQPLGFLRRDQTSLKRAPKKRHRSAK